MSTPRSISQPFWRVMAFCLLQAALAVLLGLAIAFNPHSLAGPAYKAMRGLGNTFWGALFLVPGVMVGTLLTMGKRRNAFLPLLFISAYLMFFAFLLASYGVGHPAALTGAVLFAILGGTSLLSAFTASELP